MLFVLFVLHLYFRPVFSGKWDHLAVNVDRQASGVPNLRKTPGRGVPAIGPES
jgi:hypothetical protein